MHCGPSTLHVCNEVSIQKVAVNVPVQMHCSDYLRRVYGHMRIDYKLEIIGE